MNFEWGVLFQNNVLANALACYWPYLVGRQEALAGSTAGHSGTGSHTNMWERERARYRVGLMQRQSAGRAYTALFKLESSVRIGLLRATCSMENSTLRPAVAGVWSWNHWRGFPAPPPPASLTCSRKYRFFSGSWVQQRTLFWLRSLLVWVSLKHQNKMLHS